MKRGTKDSLITLASRGGRGEEEMEDMGLGKEKEEIRLELGLEGRGRMNLTGDSVGVII